MYDSNNFNSRIPRYNDDSDYTTNAPSYYDDLARKSRLIEILAQRVYDFDLEMQKRLEEWDGKIANMPEDLKRMLQEWLKDGTLADVINEEIFQDLNNDIGKNREDIKLITLNVKDFGAKGDGVTDDRKAIQDTIDYAGEQGGGNITFGDFGDVFRITSTVYQPFDNVTLIGWGRQLMYDNAIGIALHIGKSSGNTRRTGYEGLQIYNKSLSWGTATIGLYTEGVVWSHWNGIDIEGFKRNWVLDSTTGGCAYNTFGISRIFDGETNLHIDPTGPTSWVNENSFIGGNFSVSSSRTDLERVNAINVLIEEGEGPVVNNNRFHSPSFEGQDVKAIECHGLYNVFYSPRFERSLYVELLGVGNVVFHGRGLARRFVTLGGRCQYFGSDGMIINGSTLTDEEGAIEALNGSSAVNPVFLGRSPSREEVFRVDGQGNIKNTGSTTTNGNIEVGGNVNLEGRVNAQGAITGSNIRSKGGNEWEMDAPLNVPGLNSTGNINGGNFYEENGFRTIPEKLKIYEELTFSNTGRGITYSTVDPTTVSTYNNKPPGSILINGSGQSNALLFVKTLEGWKPVTLGG